MSRGANMKKPSRTRVVLYCFEGGSSNTSFEVEARLRKAAVAGIITEWDDGRDESPWFEGPPGAKIRALRDEFVSAGFRVRTYSGPWLPNSPESGAAFIAQSNKFKSKKLEG